MSAPNQQSETIQSKGSSRAGWYAAVAVVVIVIIVFGGLYAAGYIGKPTTSNTKPSLTACTSQTILGAGSTFVEQLQDEWASVYKTGSVDYDAVGSGAGITSITAKTIAYGASDAPLNATQAAAAPGLLTMPETAGAVAVIFNLPGVNFHLGDSLNVTGAVLAEIYLGTISWWNNTAITSLNPGVTLPVQQIAVYHRSDGSGTSYAFTQFLSDSSTTWKSTISYGTLPDWPATPLGGGEKGSSGIAGTIKETPYSIGYVDLGEAASNVISYAAVENPASSYIIPTVNNTASAIADVLATTTLPAGDASWASVSMINAPGVKDYPIATFSYMLYYQAAASNPVFTSLAYASTFANWLNWTVTEGQTYSGQLYYIPLPAAVVAADQATIASMTFNGATVPTCT
ncbi:MAG: phosphate ABC transporter substrate-binding protein PstS [Thermoplasmata archaeon]